MYFGDTKELDNLFKSDKEFKKMSGIPKKIYKAALCAIFVNLAQEGTKELKIKEYKSNVELCKRIKKNPQDYNNESILKEVTNVLENAMRLTEIKNVELLNTQDKIIDFMRKVLTQVTKDQRFLVTIEEIDYFWDIEKFINKCYKGANSNLNKKSWVEFDLEKGIIPTFPDFIAYADLISLWNMYLEKKEELVTIKRFEDNLLYRKKHSEINSLVHTLFVQSITFAESYFYYLFYNLKYQENYNYKNSGTKKFLESEQPQDTEIIERIIFKEFGKKQGDTNLYKEYKKINSIRNRIIHVSAFSENNISHMMPLINLNTEVLESSLENIIKFIKGIEDRLPENLKVMHWWDILPQHPDFKKQEPGNFISRIDIY